MSRTGNNIQRQKPRTSKLAIASVLLGLVGLLILGFKVVMILYPYQINVLLRNIMGLLGVVGLIFGAVGFERIIRSKGMLKGTAFAILGIVFTASMSHLWLLERVNPRSRAAYLPCSRNLNRLAIATLKYGGKHGQFPNPNQWCDVLLKEGKVDIEQFVCPSIVLVLRWPFGSGKLFSWPSPKKGRCHFAVNPNCKPDSPPGTVLLFETKEGWNQFGGPKLLTTERHKGRGCYVSYNEADVRFVETGRFDQLKWNVEKEQNTDARAVNSGNFRRPGSDEELQYWLKNMVWFHRFTNEEIYAATGLANKEIAAGLKKFDIRPDNQPTRDEDESLQVLPYPGGRHPRIGFLEGAIEPQRETKFSVFTPWDKDSYVVVDVPEAIWSNLGLTYLAHTHIDTIWTKQGIELPKLEWNRHPDGTLDIERKLPNGIAFGVKAKPAKDAVRMEMWLKNGTDQKLTDLRVQICIMAKMAADFERQTNDNKMFTNPYAACQSNDGKRWIITAWEGCHRPWGNAKCPCFHSDPKFPDLEPGETKQLRGWLSFYEGTDVEAEFKRIEETGWRNP